MSSAPAFLARVRRALPFLQGFGRPVALVLALALALAVAGALAPLAFMAFVDALGAAAATPPAARGAALLAVGGPLGLVVVAELAQVHLGRWLQTRSGEVRLGVDFAIRRLVTARLHALPLAYHQQHGVGELLTRVNTAVHGFVTAFGELAFKTAPAVAYLVLAIAALLRLDWRLALVVLVFAPLPALVARRAAPEQTAREKQLLEHWSAVFGRFTEVLTGIRTVKAFAMEAEEERRFLAGIAHGNAVVNAGARRDAQTATLQGLAAVGARLGAAALGAWLVVRGEVTVGTLVAVLQYVSGLFGPIQGLTGIYATGQRAAVSLDAITEILDAPDAVADAANARPLPPVHGEVCFRDVTFAYEPGRPVLRHVSLRVSPGEKIALVGPSGGGKTTLVSLLERLHPLTSGAITIDGADVRALTQQSLRRQIGVVSQDVHLFNDSVLANVIYGCPGATREDAEVAARAAHAHEFIERLPDGYDTMVGERGCLLSGGQRQRLAIARALLKNPPILILDEATSALDNESEALVQAALAHLTRGRTTFIIAHRLSTVVDADRIAVLRGGRIEAIGGHAELLAQGGYYAQLFARHARGGLVGSAAPAPAMGESGGELAA